MTIQSKMNDIHSLMECRMNRRAAIITISAFAALSGCATANTQHQEPILDTQNSPIAPGSNRDFSFTVTTRAPAHVWALWTDPSTWGEWDKGLKSASMDGQMQLGSTGTITPLSGPQSSFKVVAFDPDQSYAFETRLPMAVLRVARSFNNDRTAFTHRVTFSGPMAFAFARIFGPGFRKALPPTMETLNALAEGPG